MSRRARRNHTPAFKAKVALGRRQGRSNGGAACRAVRRPSELTSWKAQLEGSAVGVFGPGSGNAAAQPAVDVKSVCVETLQDALARHGKPDIFNTDQGSQFAGSAFTNVLALRSAWTATAPGETTSSSSGWGAASNTEEVYLRAYYGVSEARASIGRYLVL